MICTQCKLNFNYNRQRITFRCTFSFCQECLPSNNEQRRKCPINEHMNCFEIKTQGDQSYINKKTDKDVKITVLGDKKVGKTTLIRSMLKKGQQALQLGSTYSMDIHKIQRLYYHYLFAYFIWDTPIKSSLFTESIDQNIDLTAKSSNVQIIVFGQSSTRQKLKKIIQGVQLKVKNPAIIIVYNIKDEIDKQLYQQIEKQYSKNKYILKVLCLDCNEETQIQKLWSIIEENVLKLQVLESKSKGITVNLAQKQQYVGIRRHRCLC